MPAPKNDIKKGMYFPTTSGEWIEILEVFNSRRIRIKFLEYKWETYTHASQIRNGEVKNVMKPSVAGVGFIGEGPEIKTDKMMYFVYTIWRGMLRRCYDPVNDFERITYKNSKVDSSWHNFRNFYTWYMEKFEKLPTVNFTWQIDKDLLFPGNTMYCPEKCCLIPSTINSLFTDRARSRGIYPLGVKKNGSKFDARCHNRERNRHLGTFSTIAEAQYVYWDMKIKTIRQMAVLNWFYLPEQLAMRLVQFNWLDAQEYYGDDARIWSDS